MSAEVDLDDVPEYEDIVEMHVSPGDEFSLKFTHAFVANGQTQWVTAETKVAALPGETQSEVSLRVQVLTLDLLNDAADNYAAVIQERREQQRAVRNGA